MTEARTSVLLNINSSTFFPELFLLARQLQESGRYEPVFLFAWRYDTVGNHIRQCLEAGIRCLDEDGTAIQSGFESSIGDAPRGGPPPGRGWKGTARRIYRKLPLRFRQNVRSFYFEGFVLPHTWFQLKRRLRFARDLMERESIGLLVLGGDLVHYDTSVFIRAAHERETRAVIVPTTMSNQLEMAESYFYSENYHLSRLSNRLLGTLYPHWVYEHRGRKLVRLPAALAFPLEWKGLAPPDPWILHSGYADAIAVESQAMADYYKAGGLPKGQLIPTGSPSSDVMHQALVEASERRTKLCVRYGLNPDWPILLSALPPDQLYGVGGRPECDFKTYEELVRFWVDSLAAVKGHNILIAVHPSVDPRAYRHFERETLKFVHETTAELIPLCDLFVASVSSTIRWAISCAKPVVNYDVYRYRYTDYCKVPGVLFTEEREDFRSLLARVTESREFFEEVSRLQHEHASHWGNLDGRAGHRMLQLFDSLASGKDLSGLSSSSSDEIVFLSRHPSDASHRRSLGP